MPLFSLHFFMITELLILVNTYVILNQVSVYILIIFSFVYFVSNIFYENISNISFILRNTIQYGLTNIHVPQQVKS